MYSPASRNKFGSEARHLFDQILSRILFSLVASPFRYERALASASNVGSISSKRDGRWSTAANEGGVGTVCLISGSTIESNFAGWAVETMIQSGSINLSRTCTAVAVCGHQT